jgi:hypothetical protein
MIADGDLDGDSKLNFVTNVVILKYYLS